MKNIYLILISMFFYVSASACSFAPSAFCKASKEFPANLIVTGKIIAIDDDGIDLEVIEVLRGEESRNIIRIWDGTDFDCNGLWSLAASEIGDLNDVVILMLPKITDIENTWDVIGDYRRGNPYEDIRELMLEGETVNGFIAGEAGWPTWALLLSLEYSIFKEDIINGGECPIVVSSNDIGYERSIIINNPFSSYLTIQFGTIIDEGMIRLFSTQGQVVHTQPIRNQQNLVVESDMIQPGFYFLEILADGRQVEILKVMKI